MGNNRIGRCRVPYWILAFVLLVSASAFASSRASVSGGERGSLLPGKGVSVRKMMGMSRSDVETMLEAIEDVEEPDPVMGAMCYEMVAGPSVIEYICPICGERTLYDDYAAVWNVEELFSVRSLFDSLTVLADMDLSLDETGFCVQCSGQEVDPAPVLIAAFEDSDPCSSAVSTEDLRLLIGFFSGETWYETFNDGRMPIRPELSRVRRLLGLPEEES